MERIKRETSSVIKITISALEECVHLFDLSDLETVQLFFLFGPPLFFPLFYPLA